MLQSTFLPSIHPTMHASHSKNSTHFHPPRHLTLNPSKCYFFCSSIARVWKRREPTLGRLLEQALVENVDLIWFEVTNWD